MGVALQELLVMHLRGKVTKPQMARLRDRGRKHISTGGHVPADDEVEEQIDDILVANHSRSVKDLVAKAIAYVYWTCLSQFLQERFRITKVKLGKALGVSPSNLNRWGKKTLPDPSKFFLALVWREIDVRAEELRFPPHHQTFGSFKLVVVEAVRLTIEQIRVRTFNKKYAHLSIVEMKCAELLYASGGSDVLLLKKPSNSKSRQALLLDIFEKIRRVFPQEKAVSMEMVEQVADQWLLSYALFDLGRPDWEFLREK